MPATYPTLSDEQLALHFPLDRPKIEGAFEIGIALAGTVSAGAYTAGVLDYILEALEAWSAAKQQTNPEVPTHRVAISTVAGASGGAINGAIVLRAAGFDFPHGATEQNPLFAAWAGQRCVTLDQLLASGTGNGGIGPLAALNTEPIENQAAAILRFPGKESPPGVVRDYFTDPIRFIATIGNVTGIPYSVGFAGQSGLGHDMGAHNDEIRFALAVPGGIARPDAAPRGDEYPIASSSPLNWDFVKEAVLATSAFPIAFDARPVERTAMQLAYRALLMPGDDDTQGDAVVPLIPRWEATGISDDKSVKATSVDGGTMDNEPIGMTRTELAGLAKRNPRDADKAIRAVVLIDPFADAETPAPTPKSILDLVAQLLSLFSQQARYRPEDLALARDETVYSRFLVAPTNDGVIGSDALSSGKLGGFLGFLDRRFLVHDFLLGRYDAFLFLTRDFRFPETNISFEGKWTAAQKVVHTSGVYAYPGQASATSTYLPMIPLMEGLRANPPAEPVRPVLNAVPTQFSGLIEGRLNFVFDRLMADLPLKGLSGSIINGAIRSAWNLWARSAIRDRLVAGLKSAL